METSLSFHRRYLNSTNRLVATTFVILICLFTQVTCAASGEHMTASHKIRHSDNKLVNRQGLGVGHSVQELSLAQRLSLAQSNRQSLPSDNIYGTFSLKSQCKDAYVGIYNDSIKAMSLNNSHITAHLKFERIEGTDYFHIKRSQSSKYVCYSRRGKLLIRSKPSKDHRCAFKQVLLDAKSDNQVIRIESVAQPKWSIGFKKTGDAMKGWHYGLKRNICFKLIKVRIPNPSQSTTDTSILNQLLHNSVIRLPLGT